MKILSYGKQSIDEKDIAAVIKVLKSDFLTQGPMVKKFEKALASYCGAKYAVAVSNGTAALHLACLAAGLKKKDAAITTPITFLATANAVLYSGADVIFSDIDYETINIDPSKLTKRISKKTKAILPVHFAGLPCDMEKISKIAKKKGLTVIEDACHAFGAKYKCGKKWIKVGSCYHSDMTVLSFHPVKHITTGEGGAILTNNKKIYEKICALRAHGIYKTPLMTKQKGPWYHEMRELGFNYRITDFQCALGVEQLKRADAFIEKRRKIAKLYDKELGDIDGIEIPSVCNNKKHTYHLYVLKINFKKFKTNKISFFKELKKTGILPQVHYIPVPKQPYYQKKVRSYEKKLQSSEKYYKRAVSIPIYPSMTLTDARRVVDSVKNVLGIN